MTRNELISLLEKEFAADEEVTFLYSDDRWMTRGIATGIDVDVQHCCESHTEVLENGKWVRYEGKTHVTNDAEYCKKWGHQMYASGYMGTRDDSWWRTITDRSYDDKKKCIVIS